MIKLTPAGAALLATAAANAQPIDLPDDVHPITVAALIKRGLLISVPADGAPSRVLATEAGRAALLLQAPAKAGEGAPAEDARTAVKPEPDSQPSPGATPPGGKLGLLVSLLRTPQGVTLEQMMQATGWQAHSVRGGLSGGIKKKLGLPVLSEKTPSGRIYRIVMAAS